MTAQVFAPSGGRRFGPSASAAAPAVAPVPARTAPSRRTPDSRAPRNRVANGPAYAQAPRVAAACSAGDIEGSYRMGRWARLAMTIIVAAALVMGAVTVLSSPADSTTTVTVAPGETMLSIVLRELPGMDPGQAIAVVERINGLTGSAVAPGMQLRVPAN